MLKLNCIFGIVAVAACGSSHKTPAVIPAWSLQNPNFDDGLTGWEMTGAVTVVDVDDIPGITKAVMLTYDGNMVVSIAQEVAIPTDTDLAIGFWQAGPTTGLLTTSVVQGSTNLDGKSSGNPNFSSGLKYGTRAGAGTLKIIWYIDGTDVHGNIAKPGSIAKITGIYLSPNTVFRSFLEGTKPSQCP